MDDFFLKAETPSRLYARLTTPEPTIAEIAAAAKTPLSKEAAEILRGFGNGDDGMPQLDPVRKLIEQRREEILRPELAALRKVEPSQGGKRFAKRAPDAVQSPGAVRLEHDEYGGIREFDSDGQLIAMYKAGVELPLVA